MSKVVGIGFKEVGKIYWFDPGRYNVKVSDKVIVETIRGLELGVVVEPIKELDDENFNHEIKPVIRIAHKGDLKAYEENREKAKKAMCTCRRIIAKHKLEMKLLDCEYTLDRSKIIIYYNADGRVDFRELLKDLASEFKVRIELRQIGPREGAKFIGGIGLCGREICCKKHLREFDLVTMKMAKDQGMALNANKIGGICGKLMCCIGYESECYEELKKIVPSPGDIIKVPNGKTYKVQSSDYIKQTVKVLNGDIVEEYQASEVVKIKAHKEVVNKSDLTDDVEE